MIYDYYPDFQIIFTGSSILDIYKGNADLSRRALSYYLPGLSFREYLNLFVWNAVASLFFRGYSFAQN